MKREWLTPPRTRVKFKSVYRPDFKPTPEQEEEHARIDEFFRTKPTMAQVQEFFDLTEEELPGYVVFQTRSIVADLRTQRMFKSLSLEQLAERSGIDATRLDEIERHAGEFPSMAVLWRIAHALDLDFVIGLAKQPAERASDSTPDKTKQKSVPS